MGSANRRAAAPTRYDRLGVDGAKAGLYVRFEPGFGLNVIVGHRRPVHAEPGPRPTGWVDGDELVMSIVGWEQLGRLVDRWRAREEALRGT